MMNPGLGGLGIPKPGQTVGGNAGIGGNGVTTDGMPLSGSTTHTSETVGLIMFGFTLLNGILPTLTGADSQASSPTCDLLAATSETQSLMRPLAVASCSSLTATLSGPGST